MRFVDQWFPLILCIREGVTEPDEVEQLAEGFEGYFRRGTQYAVLNLSSLTAQPPSARERLRLAEWANQERVRQMSRTLCVGTATVVARAWERNALVAIQWLWTPAAPHHAVSSVAEGLSYCISALVARGVHLPAVTPTVHPGLQQRIELALRAEGVAGLDAPQASKPTLASLGTITRGLDTLRDADGTIYVGWLAPGVLWARLQGRLTVRLATAYTARLAELLERRSGIRFFIDSSRMESYELLARDIATEFLLARQRCFSRLVLLSWSGGISPVGKASADTLGDKLSLLATQGEFDAELRAAAPSAPGTLADVDRSAALAQTPARRHD
jgi:hypothetical protein